MDVELVDKLGHPLAEIRSRAVGTICFKFKKGVVTSGELGRERLLLHRLVALLDAKEHASQHADILWLLSQIATTANVQEKLVKAGVIERLRRFAAPDADPDAAQLARQILALLRDGPVRQPSRAYTTAGAGAGATGYVSASAGHGTYRVSGPAILSASVQLGSSASSSMASLAGTFTASPTRAHAAGGPNPWSARPDAYQQQPLSSGLSPSRAARLPGADLAAPSTRPQSRHHARETDSALYLRPPPYLPNAIRTYEMVHLSLIDHETLDGFASLLPGPVVDAALEEKLFDIICNDFGSQTFLQQPHLLKLLLAGLDSTHTSRVSQNLEYLGRIVVAWASVFRAFVDSPTVPSVHPSRRHNDTPSVSMDHAGGDRDGGASPTWLHAADMQGSADQHAISIPYACHETLLKLVSLLRPNIFAHPILAILERISPFLKVHAETAMWKSAAELNPMTASELALYYFSVLVSPLRMLAVQEPSTLPPVHTHGAAEAKDGLADATAGSGSNLPSNALLHALLSQQVSTLALDVLASIAEFVEKPHRLVQGMLCILLAKSTTPLIVMDLVAQSLSDASSETFAFLEWLLCAAPRASLSGPILQALLDRIQSQPAFQSWPSASQTIALLVHSPLADLPDTAKNLALTAAQRLVKDMPPAELPRHALHLASVARFAPLLVTQVVEKCSPLWSDDDHDAFWIRNLFHRNEQIAAMAVDALAPALSGSMHANPFVFSSTFLAKASAGAESIRTDLARSKMGAMDLRRELAQAAASKTMPPGLADELLAFVRLNTADTQLAQVRNGALDDLLQVLGPDVVAHKRLAADDLWKLVAVVRILAEHLPVVRLQLRQNHVHSLLVGLLRASDGAPLASKLELARLCFAVVFADLEMESNRTAGSLSAASSPVRAAGSHDPGMAAAAAAAAGGGGGGGLLALPPGIHDTFHVYGPVDRPLDQPPELRLLDTSTCRRLWSFLSSSAGLTMRGLAGQSPLDRFVAQHTSKLVHAASHRAVRDALANLRLVASLDATRHAVAHHPSLHTLFRFLTTIPLSIDDHVLLQRVLRFFRECRLSSAAHDSVFRASLERVLLPLLQRHLSLGSGMDLMGTVYPLPTPAAAMATAGIIDTQLSSDLAAEMVAFIKWHLPHQPEPYKTHLAATTPILRLLSDYTHQIFASESSQAKNHRERINSLEALLVFASLPSLVSCSARTPTHSSSAISSSSATGSHAMSGIDNRGGGGVLDPSTITDMARLFVQVLGYSQHNYRNATDGNGFTYKDRSVYRWVALCLRNLSRTIIDGRAAASAAAGWATSAMPPPYPSTSGVHAMADASPATIASSLTAAAGDRGEAGRWNPAAWGDHWLFEGSLDWLLNLLHDDERTLQKFGLGVLGNLILMDGSFAFLAPKIPQFLDMAISFALDAELHISKRKEALVIINNFAVASFREQRHAQWGRGAVVSAVDPLALRGAAAGRGHAGRPSHQQQQHQHQQQPRPVPTVLDELVHVFEGSGFFDQLEDLLRSSDPAHAPYFAAMTELLQSLAVAMPDYLCHRLMAVTPWTLLFDQARVCRPVPGSSWSAAAVPSMPHDTGGDRGVGNVGGGRDRDAARIDGASVRNKRVSDLVDGRGSVAQHDARSSRVSGFARAVGSLGHRHSSGPHDDNDYNDDDDESGHGLVCLHAFEHRQWRLTHQVSSARAVQNVLQTVLLVACHNDALRRLLVTHTALFAFVAQTLAYLDQLSGLTDAMQTAANTDPPAPSSASASASVQQLADAVSTPWFWDILVTLFTTLAHLLFDMSALDPSGLVRLFSTTSPTGVQLLQFVALAIRVSPSPSPSPSPPAVSAQAAVVGSVSPAPPRVRRAACILLARLLSLHYGEVVHLDLDAIFDTSVMLGSGSGVSGGQAQASESHSTIGVSICTSLMDVITLESQTTLSDPVLLEAVRLSLQCLFGQCEFSKNAAVSARLPAYLVGRSKRIFTTAAPQGKLDEMRQVELHLIVSLLRHLFAGSTAAKSTGIDQNVPQMIAEILACRDVREPLLLETLGCLRNLVSNHDPAKRLVLDPRRNATAEPGGHSLLASLMDLVRDSGDGGSGGGRSLAVFGAAMEVLKILVLERGSRTLLFKANVGADLVAVLGAAVRQKDTARVEGIAHFFVNATFTADGQSSVMRLPGLMAWLAELLGNKTVAQRRSALLLLRNLALLRENKAHILSQGTMVEHLCGIVSTGRALRLLCPATSLVWVMIHDSEKAKVAFKKHRVGDVLARLDERLRSEYASHLAGMDDHGQHGEQRDRPDDMGGVGGMVGVPTGQGNGSHAAAPVLGGGQQLSREDSEMLMDTLRNISRVQRLLSVTV
ncbi:hypothetical protein BC831DRAFT_554181 [Entophlyctis helioformis]|nr:hypothetical protein BC831DRAFT_554181 [Entophlyctis helioformis]